jgi:phosphoserine aminotransferase
MSELGIYDLEQHAERHAELAREMYEVIDKYAIGLCPTSTKNQLSIITSILLGSLTITLNERITEGHKYDAAFELCKIWLKQIKKITDDYDRIK